jgi:hypothetical protein
MEFLKLQQIKCVIIQFSNGGAQFNAGKGLSNANEKQLLLEVLQVQNTFML